MSNFASLKEAREAKKTAKTLNAVTASLEDSLSESNLNESEPVDTAVAEFPAATKALLVKYASEKSEVNDVTHADLPTTIEVKEVEGRGRGLFTKKSIVPASTVIATTPVISVLDNRNISVRCSTCFLAEEDMPGSHEVLLQCSGCSTIKYCTAACQKTDWAGHKAECKALLAYAKARKGSKHLIPDTPIRALGRILWAKAAKGIVFSDEVDSMQSNRGILSSATEEQYFQISVSLAGYVGQETVTKTCRSAVSLLELVSRFVSNSFTLTSPHLTTIGVTISPLLSLLNHSCSPNVVVVFPSYAIPTKNPKFAKSIAIAPIKEGEELLTSYVDLALTGFLRRKELKDRYGFDCVCNVCTGEEDGDGEGKVDMRRALKCGEGGCKGFISMPDMDNDSPNSQDITCSTCKYVHLVSVDSLRSTIDRAVKVLKSAESEQYTDPKSALTSLQASIFSLHTSDLSPSSYPYLPTLQTYLSLLLYTQQFLLALPLARQTYSSLALIYPIGHPTRATTAATIGKLGIITRDDQEEFRGDGKRDGEVVKSSYWRDGKALRENLTILVAALGEVERAFGKADGGGVIGRELRALIKDAEEAIGLDRLGRD